MIILVLDIDGVLYTSSYYNHLIDKHKKSRDKYGFLFDPKCVENLNEIIKITNAKIVISSTWRSAGIEKLQKLFNERGIKRQIIGCTPIGFLYNNRGEEIQAWFEEHGMPEKIAIVDDCGIGGLFPNVYVKTDMTTGLDDIAKEKILEFLQ